jgi:hypothetical protein
MLWLIKTDLTSAGKRHLRDGAPALLLNARALNALLCEGSYFGFQIVAHEIQFIGMTRIGRVECGFRRRESEDQPAMTRVHGLEAEDVAEKCAIRFGVLAIDNDVSANDHLFLRKNPRNFFPGRRTWDYQTTTGIERDRMPLSRTILHSRQLHSSHPARKARLAHLLEHLFHLGVLTK